MMALFPALVAVSQEPGQAVPDYAVDDSTRPATTPREAAVLKGLDWLKDNQNQDGSWGKGNKSGTTGLALRVFLAHGETPVSEKYGDSVRGAIEYLVELSRKNHGKLIPMGGEKSKHWPYEHAIATYALADALVACKEAKIPTPGLDVAVRKAGQYIIVNQHMSGGWDYGYKESGTRGGDMSLTSWHILALDACRRTGLEYLNMRPCIQKALDFCKKHQAKSGGFGYWGTAPIGDPGYHTLTGAGVYCFQTWGKADLPVVQKGLKYIAEKSKFQYNTKFCDLYAAYYESRAMKIGGGEAWKKYRDNLLKELIENQSPDGSWPPPGGGQKPRAVAPIFITNTTYRTCLCLLILEVC